MSVFQAALLVGALLAALLSWGSWRSIGWLVAIMVDQMLTVAYWKSGLPYAELIAGSADAAVCLGIYFFGRWRWEMWIWRLMQAQVLVNVIFLASNLYVVPRIDQDTYASILEALNWIAILSIGGIAVLQRIGYDLGRARLPWAGFRGLVRTLRSQRSTPPFTAKS